MTPDERLSKLLDDIPGPSAAVKAHEALIQVNRSYQELTDPTEGQTQAYLHYLETLWGFPDAWRQADPGVLQRIRNGISFFRKNPDQLQALLPGFLKLQQSLLTA